MSDPSGEVGYLPTRAEWVKLNDQMRATAGRLAECARAFVLIEQAAKVGSLVQVLELARVGLRGANVPGLQIALLPPGELPGVVVPDTNHGALRPVGAPGRGAGDGQPAGGDL